MPEARPLRLWPGAVLVALQWTTWFLLPILAPGIGGLGFPLAILLGLGVFLWWLVFSRARWLERLGAIVVMVIAVIATRTVVHPSLANGMMGMLVPLYAIPLASAALVAWAVISRQWRPGFRRAGMVSTIVVACAVLLLVRTDGISGEGDSDFHWRWTPTAEERLLAETRGATARTPAAPRPAESPGSQSPAPAASPPQRDRAMGSTVSASSPAAAVATLAPDPAPEWPGFRGPRRDGIVRGTRVDIDWARTPPTEMWRRPVGPGWSSFAVAGDLIFTQEQRGDDEIVSAYRFSSGEPVWVHRDPVRFWESNGGAGPRATPTLHGGRVYALGATGVLNVLDVRTGATIWSRQAATETNTELPGWGFSASPVVVGDLVVVALSGRLVAYDAATGAPRWSGQVRGGGYSSPQLVTIGSVPQILLLSGGGAVSVAPADGAVLWEHTWESGASIVQPAMAGDDVILSGAGTMGAIGMRRLSITRGANGWTAETRWTTRGLKPYFNDFVVHEGHAYGFDGSILAAIDLSDGTRRWKGGRYGSGQMVLLPDQDLLLVVSEEGELALVRAAPDRFTEVARVPGIEGKTWNHPVLVGGVMLVRNGEEMAAFRVAK